MKAGLIELSQNVTTRKQEHICTIFFLNVFFFCLVMGFGAREKTSEMHMFNLANKAHDVLILLVIFANQWLIYFRMRTQEMIK